MPGRVGQGSAKFGQIWQLCGQSRSNWADARQIRPTVASTQQCWSCVRQTWSNLASIGQIWASAVGGSFRGKLRAIVWQLPSDSIPALGRRWTHFGRNEPIAARSSTEFGRMRPESTKAGGNSATVLLAPPLFFHDVGQNWLAGACKSELSISSMFATSRSSNEGSSNGVVKSGLVLTTPPSTAFSTTFPVAKRSTIRHQTLFGAAAGRIDTDLRSPHNRSCNRDHFRPNPTRSNLGERMSKMHSLMQGIQRSRSRRASAALDTGLVRDRLLFRHKRGPSSEGS